MLNTLPVCPIPEEISWALKMRFHNNKKSYAIIADEIYSNDLLKVMIPKLFTEYMKNNSFESMLHALGWRGFRDRLVSIYIYKFKYGQFPTKLDLTLSKDIKVFEEAFRDFVPDGDSRMFMLGLYFKFCELSIRGSNSTGSLFKTSNQLMELLKQGSQKSLRFDWLFLSLKILETMFGHEQLESRLKKNKSNFFKIFNELEVEQRSVLLESLLAYGASINEEDMFHNDRV